MVVAQIRPHSPRLLVAVARVLRVPLYARKREEVRSPEGSGQAGPSGIPP